MHNFEMSGGSSTTIGFNFDEETTMSSAALNLQKNMKAHFTIDFEFDEDQDDSLVVRRGKEFFVSTTLLN